MAQSWNWILLYIFLYNIYIVQAQLGLLCSKDSDCKMSSSFTCGPNKSCVCQRGYKFSILKLGCQRYLVNHQEKCDPSRDVCSGGSNAICIANFLGERAVCQCKSGYLFDDKTKLCQSKEFIQSNNQPSSPTSSPQIQATGVPPGGSCNSNQDCRGFPNATCYSYVTTGKRLCDCSYDSHYYDSKLERCVPKKEFGSPCENVEQCLNLQNIECSAPHSKQNFKSCTCKINFYYDKKTQRCSPSMNIGENCQQDQQCKARPHSYCTSQGHKGQLRCSCLPGKEFYEAAGTCVDTSGKIRPGQPCKTSEQCIGGPNAACLNIFLGAIGPICSCKDNYVFDEGSNMCLKTGEKPGMNTNPSQSNNDSPNFGGGGGGGGSQNIDLNLKFDVNIKVICNPDGKCKTMNSTVLQTQR